VVIPVFNGAGCVGEAVASALAQDHRPLQVIVVDDGSTDGTAAVVEALAAPEVELVRQPNRGHGAAKNTGVARAGGGYVAFLDADDVWLPGKLTAQLALLEAHPEVGFTVCGMRTVVTEDAAAALSPRQLERITAPAPGWLPSALVARRSVFDVVGGFDESLRYGNDTDWFARARAAGVASAVLDEVLLERRLHGGNQSMEVDEMHGELLRVVRSSIARRRGRG
jgi:glycosyltransferase involved in cell wall biosynthesis